VDWQARKKGHHLDPNPWERKMHTRHGLKKEEKMAPRVTRVGKTGKLQGKVL